VVSKILQQSIVPTKYIYLILRPYLFKNKYLSYKQFYVPPEDQHTARGAPLSLGTSGLAFLPFDPTLANSNLAEGNSFKGDKNPYHVFFFSVGN
jgi:hypothetical protein